MRTFARNCRDRWVCWWGDRVELADMREQMVETAIQFIEIKRSIDQLRWDYEQACGERDSLRVLLVESHEQRRTLEGQLLVAEAELAANRSTK
jgi:hypothetical protein